MPSIFYAREWHAMDGKSYGKAFSCLTGDLPVVRACGR